MPTRISVTAIVLLLSAVATVSGKAESSTSRDRLLVLAGGDQVRIKGTHLYCTVSVRVPRRVSCGIEEGHKPELGSYGFYLNDSVALLTKTAARGTFLVALRHQPTVTGASFPPTVRAPRVRTVAAWTALEVSGTHILCLVTTDPKKLPVVTCGLHTVHYDVFVYGSYLGELTSRSASLLLKPSQDQLTTVVGRTQP